MAHGESICYLPAMLQYHYVDLERLKLSYLVRKGYQRSRTITRVRRGGGGVPRYLWKKLAIYAAKAAVFCLGMARRRFYMVRTASVLGEISGSRQAQDV